jgi:putative flippase GtrA
MSDRNEFLRQRVGSLLSGVRFGKFVSVGVVGAVCDTLVLMILAEGLGVFPEIATLAGIETAILVMFLINENWTFANQGSGDRSSFLARLKRSHVVRAGGVTTQFVLWLLVYRVFHEDLFLGDVALWGDLTAAMGVGGLLAGLDLWLIVAKGTGISVGMLVNYVFESLFTWKDHE